MSRLVCKAKMFWLAAVCDLWLVESNVGRPTDQLMHMTIHMSVHMSAHMSAHMSVPCLHAFLHACLYHVCTHVCTHVYTIPVRTSAACLQEHLEAGPAVTALTTN